MKKVKTIISLVDSKFAGRKFAAMFSVAVAVLATAACAVQFSPVSDAISSASVSGDNNQKMILELSETYLSPKSINNISVLDYSSVLSENESEIESMNLIEELSSETESETLSSKPAETTTEKETTTKMPETTTKAVATTSAPVTEKVPVAYSPAGYTFSQLGINQMSVIPVPDDILFDENGIPLNYSYKLSGKATAYNMGTTTATGTSVHPGVVAVNPRIIPYGSKMYIVASDGSGYVYGYSSAEDTGGFIYWNNAPIVDMYVNSYSDACYWGNRPVTVYVF